MRSTQRFRTQSGHLSGARVSGYRLVLASTSPRRRELLRNAGLSFEVVPAHLDEDPNPGEAPEALALRLAREKARAVFSAKPDCVVLGADTVVVVGEEALGKPADARDAARMLQLLSGQTHTVLTGVCLLGEHFEDARSVNTEVTMAAITDREIQEYIATGEPMDKAGAYAIQGMASRWVTRIVGDYFNVVGLPVSLVFGMLAEHGLQQKT